MKIYVYVLFMFEEKQNSGRNVVTAVVKSLFTQYIMFAVLSFSVLIFFEHHHHQQSLF